jgi:GR25 family glycosyltransferase involved in LPS biosynthesis
MNKEEQHIHNILKDVPIFWINLERSERRRNIMQSELYRYQLANTRIDAVDGNNINLDEYKKMYKINDKMNKYEVACALSHLKAIKMCYDQGVEYALILEDDANFDYFPYKTDTLLELLNELKTVNGECLQLANIISKNHMELLKLSKNKLSKCDSTCAVAYVLTKSGMKRVLDNFENNKKLEVSEYMIFNIANNFLTPPYFSYPFLRNDKGEKLDVSTIRANTKGAHATQTISKMLWDDYYKHSNDM